MSDEAGTHSITFKLGNSERNYGWCNTCVAVCSCLSTEESIHGQDYETIGTNGIVKLFRNECEYNYEWYSQLVCSAMHIIKKISQQKNTIIIQVTLGELY